MNLSPAIALVAMTLIASAAQSETAAITLHGKRLVVYNVCAKVIAIEPGAADHAVEVVATYRNATDFAALIMTSGEDARIAHGGGSICVDESGGLSVASTSGNNVFMVGAGQFIVNGKVITREDLRPTTLELQIKVPYGLPIAIQSALSSIAIGQTDGTLDVQLYGSGGIDAKSVSILTVMLSGSGSLHVGTVSGNARIQLMGSGSVAVEEGEIPSLTVSIAGSGDFRYGGAVKQANLTVTGSGNIALDHAPESLSTSRTGSGSIRAGP
jgi:hypothetical protein